MVEISFGKYARRGAYHWDQISRHPVKRNAFVLARYEKCIELLRQNVPSPEARVLDLGCGDGALTSLLAKVYGEVHGADPSEIGIALAREMTAKTDGNVTFVNHSGYDTGYETGFFDGVICSDVIEHVREPQRLLGEIHRILKPGATAVISTPIRFTEKPLDAEHVVEWFAEEFHAVVRTAFPDARLTQSHPLIWMEFLTRSRWTRVTTNLVSLFRNPFSAETGWRYYALQFAVARKPMTDPSPRR